MEKNEFYMDEKHWDKYTDTFVNVMEFNLLQTATTIYTHTRAWERKKILDAGAGSGRSSRMFINAFMQPGTVLYWSDISQKMVDKFEQGFLSSELNGNEKIKLTVLPESDSIEVEEYDPNNLSKRIFLTIADNSKLPFPDESFDLFVSGHCVQYSDEPKSQLKEAFRVLQKGGVIGLGVGGRNEQWKQHYLVADAMELNDIIVERKCRIFSLGDEDVLKSMAEEVGFKDVKAFYQMTNLIGYPEELFKVAIFFDPYKTIWEQLTEDKKYQIFQSYKELFEERYGRKAGKPGEFETLFLIAYKD